MMSAWNKRRGEEDEGGIFAGVEEEGGERTGVVEEEEEGLDLDDFETEDE